MEQKWDDPTTHHHHTYNCYSHTACSNRKSKNKLQKVSHGRVIGTCEATKPRNARKSDSSQFFVMYVPSSAWPWLPQSQSQLQRARKSGKPRTEVDGVERPQSCQKDLLSGCSQAALRPSLLSEIIDQPITS